MGADETAVLEQADLVGEDVDIEDAAARRIRDAVEIATDAHHALVGYAPFELEDRPVGCERQRLHRRLLLGEGLVDDALRRRVQARIGNRVEPAPKLRVEIVEVAERAAEEEVLTDVAERPFDLAFGLRPVGPAGSRLEAVVPGQVDKAAIVDDQTVGILADHRRLHPIVEDLAWRPADRLDRGDVTAQDRLQVLMDDKASPDQARIAEHHGEQPDNARHSRLVHEHDLEAGEINLALLAGRSLEPYLEGRDGIRPDAAHRPLHGGVAAGIATLA